MSESAEKSMACKCLVNNGNVPQNINIMSGSGDFMGQGLPPPPQKKKKKKEVKCASRCVEMRNCLSSERVHGLFIARGTKMFSVRM